MRQKKNNFFFFCPIFFIEDFNDYFSNNIFKKTHRINPTQNFEGIKNFLKEK